MTQPPHRKVAFLFTDIEGSTRLWEEFASSMESALARHDRLVDGLIEEFGGQVIDHAGDGAFAIFEAGDPLGCCLAIQQQLQHTDWGELEELRVRIAVHAGTFLTETADYRGRLANKAARVLSIGWGGQTLTTPETLQAFLLPPGASTIDLGRHQLKDLRDPQRVYQLTHPTLEFQAFPELRSLSIIPNNLPRQPSRFIGRATDLSALGNLLTESKHRAVSIVGGGGVGKTRLALQLVGEHIEHFRDGVFFVPLSSIDSADQIAPAIAQALNLSLYGREEPRAQIIRHLSGSTVLLLLDNFEHVLEGAEIVGGMLEGLPNLTVLITSRERLGLRGEAIYSLAGLSHSDSLQTDSPATADLDDSDAVCLFMERATALDSSFDPDEADRQAIHEICRLVDGLPLGIELAAPWTRLLSCHEISEEIERSAGFLESTSSDVPKRHRSMLAVFEYSWSLLTVREREVFCQLSIFRGAFDRAAAEQVAGASLLHLAALMDKSLIRRTRTSRFFIHELLRQFGETRMRARSSEYRELRNRHCKFFADLLERRKPDLRGHRIKEAAEEIQANLGNIRMAWAWACTSGDVDALDRSIEQLMHFFETQGRLHEGVEFFSQAADVIMDLEVDARRRDRLSGLALVAHGKFLTFRGDYEEAIEVLERGLKQLLSHDLKVEVGYALFILAATMQGIGRYDDAVVYLEESLAELEEADEPYRLAHSQISLGQVYAWLGEVEKSRHFYEMGISKCDETGDIWAKMCGQLLLGEVILDGGDRATAKTLFEESLTFLRKLGDRRWTISCLSNLGRLAFESKDYEPALAHYSEAAELARKVGDERRLTIALARLGKLQAIRSDGPPAKSYFSEALQIAWSSRLLPEVLDLLVDLSEILLAEGRPEPAARVLAAVQAHEASKQKTLERASEMRQGSLDLTHLDSDILNPIEQVVSLDALVNEISRWLGSASETGRSLADE